jgi:hypothetical protein
VVSAGTNKVDNNTGASISGGVGGTAVGGAGFEVTGGTVSLRNLGTIAAGGTGNLAGHGLSVASGATANIVNLGTISGSSGISNQGTMNLDNAQAGLTFSGKLPEQYKVIISALPTVNTPNTFGQIAVTNGSGSTTFGISSESATGLDFVSRRVSGEGWVVLEDVVQGVPGSAFNNTVNSKGWWGRYAPQVRWKLDNTSTDAWSDAWDLKFFVGPSTEDTQASLERTATQLRKVYASQMSNLNVAMGYDCTLFDQRNLCLSFSGRQASTLNGENNSSNAAINVAYRMNANWRLGAWVDQNNSVRSSVGIELSRGSPMVGGYLAWSEKGGEEGLGAKVATGHGQRNMTVTRSVGDDLDSSEPGTGSTSVAGTSMAATLSYGFKLNDTLLASPYLGVRYSQIKTDGYTEKSSASMMAPLTFAALTQNASTLVTGLVLKAKIGEGTSLHGSLGFEQDLTYKGGSYSAKGDVYSETGTDHDLKAISFNSDALKTRGTASVGLQHNLNSSTRLSAGVLYRTEAFKDSKNVTAYTAISVGF